MILALIALLILATFTTVIVFGVRMHLRQLNRQLALDHIDHDSIVRKWQDIQALLAENADTSRRSAVREADKLLHYVVKELLYEGQPLEVHWQEVRTYEERFDGVSEAYDTVQLLAAGKITDFSQGQAASLVRIYERALKSLNVIS